MRDWYAKNRERVLEQQRERRITSNTTREYDKMRWHTDLEYRRKKTARIKVKTAITRGNLTRQACEVCAAWPAEAHHDDYDRPLDVRWLCATHHREHHVAENAKRVMAA